MFTVKIPKYKFCWHKWIKYADWSRDYPNWGFKCKKCGKYERWL